MAQMSAACPRCGGPISGTEALCPECLKRVALQEAMEVDESGATGLKDLLPETTRRTSVIANLPAETRGPAGERWGDYELLEPVGRGAMGTVFKARNTRLNRLVALKVIKLGMDTRSVVARFDAERQALAMMDHPNIATVLDAGASETGRHSSTFWVCGGVAKTGGIGMSG